MAIPAKLTKYLEQHKIKYEIVEHRKVFTALDAVHTQKLKPQLQVKTLVMRLDNDYALALLTANRNLDKGKFKQTVNKCAKQAKQKAIKKIDFAKEAWMKKHLIGKVGATPAFGKLLKLPVYMDSLVYKNKQLQINSGEYTASLKISLKDFVKLEMPVKGSFSMAKK